MGIVFEENSNCPLCGNVIDKNSVTVSFPNFTSNVNEPLFIVSDRRVHLDCLNKNDLKRKAIFFKEKYYENIPSPNSRCNINGDLITNPKDLIVFGLLTSDENEDLYKYNYMTFSKKNIAKWEHVNQFIVDILEFKRLGKWKSYGSFNYLDYLLSEFSQSIKSNV